MTMNTPTESEINAMSRTKLGALYLKWIGYNPFIETSPASPPVSDDEIRNVLIEYRRELMSSVPHEPITPPGWTLIETGGGCTALVRNHPCSHEPMTWYITRDIDAGTPTDPHERVCLGLYGDSGWVVAQWSCSCLAEAVQIAEGAKP